MDEQQPIVPVDDVIEPLPEDFDPNNYLKITTQNSSHFRQMCKMRIATVLKNENVINEKIDFEYNEPKIGQMAMNVYKAIGDIKTPAINKNNMRLTFSRRGVRVLLAE